MHYLLLIIFFFQLSAQKSYEISSPNERLKVIIKPDEHVTIGIYFDNEILIEDIKINKKINKFINLAKLARVISHEISNRQNLVIPTIPVKNKEILDEYNELTLNFSGKTKIEFRAYNYGFAYRFVTSMDKEITIHTETMELNVPLSMSSYLHPEKSMYSHYERSYEHKLLAEFPNGTLSSLPIQLKSEHGTHVVITESDLSNYPNMFLEKTKTGLEARFPKRVLKTEMVDGKNSDRSEIIVKEADYIAKTRGNRSFPWRVFVISDRAADLVESELVYLLASETKIEDTSWIKAGKVAWDWWNALNLQGVDFKPGINLETYKYYVDFASKNGIEYVILDEGWSKTTSNILEYKDELNVEELVAYAKERNVGIILWVLWRPLDDFMKETYTVYNLWGVKGVKIDFMQRADQDMVAFYERAAKLAAEYELLVNYHGAYKPSGLNRTYPNVLNFEGLKGLEHVKWSKDITAEHNLTLPFIRMVAGPMDYTPGAMINRHQDSFEINFNRPMSMTTRAHQVAMYIVYDAPLQMLADSPTNYEAEQETTDFISEIPTTWDLSYVLAGEISEYIITLRQKGDVIYLAAMSNSEAREIKVNLNFLDKGDYSMDIFRDNEETLRNAEAYTRETISVDASKKIIIKMTSAGGWSAIIKKK